MKVTTILIFAFLMQVSAAGLAQKITLNERNASLESVMDKIRAQTGYEFVFNVKDIDNAKRVSVSFKTKELNEALEVLFEGQALSYSVKDKFIVVRPKEKSLVDRITERWATIDVRGVVRNEKGELLEGVTVSVKGANNGTSTNAKGEFLLKGVSEDAILVFSGVSIETYEVRVNGKTQLNVNVRSRQVQLEEVAINTGYQKISKERFVGSYSQLDSPAFHRRAGMGILERLDGTVTGMLFNKKGDLKSMQIRGLSSLGAGSALSSLFDPLIVVDNFPMETTRFDINSLNPNDVESVTVLKDAAAASIWGARAGNGVIVITTKKGKYDQTFQIAASSNFTIQSKPNLFYIPTITSSEFIDIERELFDKGFYNDKLTDNFLLPQVSPVVEILNEVGKNGFTQADADASIDKFRQFDLKNDLNKYIYQKALQQQHYLSFNGGSSNLNYQLSGGFNKARPNIQGSNGAEQFTLNSNVSFRPLKKIEIQTGIGYSYQVNHNNEPFVLPYSAPYTRLVDDNGKALSIPYLIRTAYIDSISDPGLLDWRYRPLDEIRAADNRALVNAINLNINATYRIFNFLSANIAINYRSQIDYIRNHKNLQTFYTRDLINRFFNPDPNVSTQLKYPIPLGGIVDLIDNKASGYKTRFNLNFNKEWGNDHKLTALLGYDRSEDLASIRVNRQFGYNEANGSLQAYMDYVNYYPITYGPLSGFSEPVEPNQSYRESLNRAISFFTNASYTYRNKYTLYGSARSDAANVFGVKANNRWKPLWSIGGKWELSKEGFYSIDWLPLLHLRGSFGYAGNTNLGGSGRFTISYSPFLANYTNLIFAAPGTPNNPNLKWEEVRTTNFGFDFDLIDRRLSGRLDLFQKRSKDLIALRPFDPTSGILSHLVNSASLKANGLELELNSSNLQGKFKWNTGFGLSKVKTLVSKIDNGRYRASDFIAYDINPTVGKLAYSIASYRWAGLDPKTGDPQGYLNGQISKDYNAIFNDSVSNQVYHGSAIPIYSIFLNNSFSWRNITLSFNITGRFDFYFRKPPLQLIHSGEMSNSSYTLEYNKRWRKPGDELYTNVPSVLYPVPAELISRGSFYAGSEINVVRGDNVRLQDVRLQYQWINTRGRLPFKSLMISVYPNNLNIILWRANKYKLDPDFSGGSFEPTAAPTAPTWTFSFNLNI